MGVRLALVSVALIAVSVDAGMSVLNKTPFVIKADVTVAICKEALGGWVTGVGAL